MRCADQEKRFVVDRRGTADCRHWEYACTPPALARLATYSGGAFIIVYFFAYVYYLHRGFRLLRSRPYASFRVGNLLLRVQVLACSLLRFMTSQIARQNLCRSRRVVKQRGLDAGSLMISLASNDCLQRAWRQ